MIVRRNNLVDKLLKKKAFLYKIRNKYYILSNLIFDSCNDEDIIAEYESIFSAIRAWETRVGKGIREERLQGQDLRVFIPHFDRIRVYCDECEEREIRAISLSEHTIPDSSGIKAGVRKRIEEFLQKLNDEENDMLELQIREFEWLSEQSICYEADRMLMKNNH